MSDNQIKDAFRAAGATRDETEGFSAQIRKRINELQAAARWRISAAGGSERFES